MLKETNYTILRFNDDSCEWTVGVLNNDMPLTSEQVDIIETKVNLARLERPVKDAVLGEILNDVFEEMGLDYDFVEPSCDICVAPEEMVYRVLGWVSEHKQALKDIENHFGEEIVFIKFLDILGWLYEHEQLWEDFINHSFEFYTIAKWFVTEKCLDEWEEE